MPTTSCYRDLEDLGTRPGLGQPAGGFQLSRWTVLPGTKRWPSTRIPETIGSYLSTSSMIWWTLLQAPHQHYRIHSVSVSGVSCSTMLSYLFDAPLLGTKPSRAARVRSYMYCLLVTLSCGDHLRFGRIHKGDYISNPLDNPLVMRMISERSWIYTRIWMIEPTSYT